MTKSAFVIFAILLCLSASCGLQQSPTGSDSPALPSEDLDNTNSQLSGTEVLSANLSLFVGFASGKTVNVHRITAEWDPLTITWNNFAGGFSTYIEDSFTTLTSGRQNMDMTTLVQSWVDETQPNFGILLDQASPGFSPQIVSSLEAGSLAPFLVICHNSEGSLVCDTIAAQADVFIDEAQPDYPKDGSTSLLVAQMMTPGSDKQALIRFDLPDYVDQQLPSTIGGQVWNDVNQDGVRDQNESGLPSVVVNLYDCQDNFLFAGVTDDVGAYLFADLSASSYVVEFVAPDGYLFSPPGQGVDDTLNSDADPATGRTMCIDVVEGEVASFWSTGLYIPIDLDDPDDPDDFGCTRGKGYWKNHAGFGPQLDEISVLLPVLLGTTGGDKSLSVEDAKTAVEVLAMKTYGSPKNGITKLYAQLLAAKLNIASGADAEIVAATIDEADAFLADHDWLEWEELDRAIRHIVLEWKDILQSYNNGEIGPGCCE
jgi:hypothetical protein